MPINLSHTFNAFKSRNYSLYFWGQFISRIGMWMQRTAVIWVVYTMTHSAFMIGLTTFAEQFPSFLLSPLGGIVADRYDRYKVLMVTQIASALQATALTLLYFSHYHSVWMILVLSVLLGVANAFDVPARQPMVNDLIRNRDDLPGAIALNASSNNLARLVGPALSGFVLSLFGASICFATNAVSFIAVIVSIKMMQLPPFQKNPEKKRMSADFSEGYRYVTRTPDIGITLLLLAVICLLVATYDTLVPVYAKDIFHGDASTYGLINASGGIGAVISTFYIASRPPGTSLKKMLFINLIILGLGLILISHLSSLPLFLLLAAVCGFGVMSVIPLCNTIVQVASSPEMRGRVISFFAMAAFGTLPIGSLLVGGVSKWTGARNCLLVQGIFALLIAACFSSFLYKRIRKIPPGGPSGGTP